MAKRRRPGAEDIERLQLSGLDQLVRNVARAAKVNKRVYPHLFRHSYISYMLKRGVPPAVVMKLVGHSSSELIFETYNRLQSKDASAQVIKALLAKN